jgi:hypothetical protein
VQNYREGYFVRDVYLLRGLVGRERMIRADRTLSDDKSL